MTGGASAVASAATFIWLGMVLAISFLEAPLKFRAPGITLPLGLGIGRLVFRALNRCEIGLAVVVVAAMIVDRPPGGAVLALGGAMIVLAAQLVVVRPRLSRRSEAVLAGAGPAGAGPDGAGPAGAGPDGGSMPRSRAHLAYVALEMIKVVGLLVGGIVMLS